MNIIDGGITAAKGFFAAGIQAGIKNAKKDMAVIYSEKSCKTAGVFTKNIVKAAPVKWDMHILKECEFSRAVIINSGVANACTGNQGYEYCEEMARKTSEEFKIKKEEVHVASTGVIGKQLPMDKINKGIEVLSKSIKSSLEAGSDAATAIMTTDTVSKEIAVNIEIDGKKVVVGGMCKGSGMIHPDMCTMLGFVTTDINISKEMLQLALSEDVEDTYNMISVDGDTSTNDTVLLMANGEAGNSEIVCKDENYNKFLQALNFVNEYLSKKIAGDGEGATALFEVKVLNAIDKEQAVGLSKAIVTSSLTKAAIFGHDANWGRILCAMGYSGKEFDPEIVDIYFESVSGKLKIVENGMATDYDEKEATEILSQPEVTAIADLKQGKESATAWGCDLTYDYIKINADYRS